MKSCQILVTRLPYAETYDTAPIMEMIKNVDEKGLICISMPIHVENPSNGYRLTCQLQDMGLFLVSCVTWRRDRHIVTTKSKRLTNAWEPLSIFSKTPDYFMNREAAYKIKKGFEGREAAFDEDEYLTCVGDHWPVRNDRRDRRFLPAQIVMNCCQLGNLNKGDRVLDPYGNQGIKDSCKQLGWEYIDGKLESTFRSKGKK